MDKIVKQKANKQLARQKAESRFKRTLSRWRTNLTLPPPPEPTPLPVALAGAAPEQKELWQLRADVDALRKRYDLLARYVVRGVLAIISVVAPLCGWGFVNQVIKILGFKL